MNSSDGSSGQHDWVTPSEDPGESLESGPADPSPNARRIKMAAVATAIALVGGGTVLLTGHHSSNASAAIGPGGNAGFGGPPGTSSGGPSGSSAGGPSVGSDGHTERSGEQHIQGTITAISGSHVTIKTTAGTHSYVVTSQTQIMKDGATATLAQLKTGDSVFAHVYPSSGKLLVERLFDGALPSFGSQGGPGGPPPGVSGNGSGSGGVPPGISGEGGMPPANGNSGQAGTPPQGGNGYAPAPPSGSTTTGKSKST